MCSLKGATESLTMLKRLVQHFPLSCPQHMSSQVFVQLSTHFISRCSVSVLLKALKKCYLQLITKSISKLICDSKGSQFIVMRFLFKELVHLSGSAVLGYFHNYKTPGANPKEDVIGWLGKDLWILTVPAKNSQWLPYYICQFHLEWLMYRWFWSLGFSF